MSHIHNIIDTDRHFVINPINRAMSVKADKLILSQYDHDSERFTFEFPRYIEEHDMTLCDRVEIHYSNISKTKKEKYDDVYIVTDMSCDNDTAFFSWLISENATKLVGTISFSITFLCHDDEGKIVYNWGTDIFNSISVIARYNYTPGLLESNSDLIDALKRDVFDKTLDNEEVEKIIADYVAANPPVNGEDGEDGISPTITVEEIENGHRITFIDINGNTSIDVMNGIIGKDGYTPVKGIDYFNEEDKEEVSESVLAKLLASTELKQMLATQFSQFVVIGDTEPESGPVLWFDTNIPVVIESSEIMLVLGGEDDESEVLANVDDSDYPVLNTESPVEVDGGASYAITINQ